MIGTHNISLALPEPIDFEPLDRDSVLQLKQDCDTHLRALRDHQECVKRDGAVYRKFVSRDYFERLRAAITAYSARSQQLQTELRKKRAADSARRLAENNAQWLERRKTEARELHSIMHAPLPDAVAAAQGLADQLAHANAEIARLQKEVRPEPLASAFMAVAKLVLAEQTFGKILARAQEVVRKVRPQS